MKICTLLLYLLYCHQKMFYSQLVVFLCLALAYIYKDLRLLVAQPSTEEYVNKGGAEANADVYSIHLRVGIKEVCWNLAV